MKFRFVVEDTTCTRHVVSVDADSFRAGLTEARDTVLRETGRRSRYVCSDCPDAQHVNRD